MGGGGAALTLPFRPAEKVSSLGKDWHRFCLRCEHCSKTLTPGGHAEVSPAPRQGGGGEPGQTPPSTPALCLARWKAFLPQALLCHAVRTQR